MCASNAHAPTSVTDARAEAGYPARPAPGRVWARGVSIKSGFVVPIEAGSEAPAGFVDQSFLDHTALEIQDAVLAGDFVQAVFRIRPGGLFRFAYVDAFVLRRDFLHVFQFLR